MHSSPPLLSFSLMNVHTTDHALLYPSQIIFKYLSPVVNSESLDSFSSSALMVVHCNRRNVPIPMNLVEIIVTVLDEKFHINVRELCVHFSNNILELYPPSQFILVPSVTNVIYIPLFL